MVKDGWINKLEQTLLNSSLFREETINTSPEKNLRKSMDSLTHQAREAGKSQDISRIVTVERMFLGNDLDRRLTSDAQRRSLEQAVQDLGIAERHIGYVSDPKEYLFIAKGYSRNKSRTGGLPLDEGRQFFRSHAARLLNQDKSPLSDEEKRLLDARKNNMRTAESLYIALQRKALGVEKDPKSCSRGMAM